MLTLVVRRIDISYSVRTHNTLYGRIDNNKIKASADPRHIKLKNCRLPYSDPLLEMNMPFLPVVTKLCRNFGAWQLTQEAAAPAHASIHTHAHHHLQIHVNMCACKCVE